MAVRQFALSRLRRGQVPSPVRRSNAPLFFSWNRQPEHRRLSLSRDVHPTHVFRVRQIKRLAMFTAINFSVRSPLSRHVSATLLYNIVHVVPAFQVAAAQFSLGILFVAGTLSLFFDLYLVIGKLRHRYHIARGQRFPLIPHGPPLTPMQLRSFYSKRQSC